ncbi:MAG: hypothetical protein H7Y88_08570 [Phycisphaerales bacterium]|nr:hypothetical protein [Phycisphaerales bacterium]
MTSDQLRQALRELNGERDLTVVFSNVFDVSGAAPGGPSHAACRVKKAMLIPDEPDHLVKVTDGHAIFILDADRIAWIRIG